MIIHYHNHLEATTPYPGLHRLTSMDQSLGSGAITQDIVMIEPARQSRPHTHLIEESMMLLEGSLPVLIGNEVTGVHARATFLAPATTVHAVRNIGDAPVVHCIAYPGVNVMTSFVRDVDF